MNFLNAIVNFIAGMLSYALPTLSASNLHNLALVSLLIIIAGVVIVSPGILFILVLILAVLYFAGIVK
jgi:hypothetical protein